MFKCHSVCLPVETSFVLYYSPHLVPLIFNRLVYLLLDLGDSEVRLVGISLSGSVNL